MMFHEQDKYSIIANLIGQNNRCHDNGYTNQSVVYPSGFSCYSPKMDYEQPRTALVSAAASLRVVLQGAGSLWASATTGETARRQDLLRDKQRIVLSFFKYVGKLPWEVEPGDVQS